MLAVLSELSGTQVKTKQRCDWLATDRYNDSTARLIIDLRRFLSILFTLMLHRAAANARRLYNNDKYRYTNSVC